MEWKVIYERYIQVLTLTHLSNISLRMSPVTTIQCAQGTGDLRGLRLGGSWRMSVNIYRIVSSKAAEFAFTFLTNTCVN